MKQDILFLNDKLVNELAGNDMAAVIHDVERALSLLDSGEAINPEKAVMKWGKTVEDENTLGRINAMGAYLGGEYQMAGIKWIGSNPLNFKKGLPRASVTVILNDPETKLPVAISDGTKISVMRTGAAGGLAVKYLAKKDAGVMTICGAGAQSRTQLEAALLERPSISQVYIYDIVPEYSQTFAKEMTEKFSINVTPVTESQLAEAAGKSDIITTVTLATEPIIKAEWIKKGTLLCNMADYEFTYDCVKLADKIVVDTWANIKHRMISTVALMYRDGLITDDDINAHLGEIINGRKNGRENDDEIIYFNAVGMGIEDLAVVTRAYKKAKELGLGQVVNYWAE